jgi:ATP-dependent Lon protease
MEIISLAGYTEGEKLQIARRYLLARQLTANGLRQAQVVLDDDVLLSIIHGYTREAGVRSLEREVGRLLRHEAVKIAEGCAQQATITANDLPAILGPPRFESEVAMRTSVPGVATGLAWTPVGGDILFIEATRSPGKSGLLLTGQLGEVMKESALAALSLVKNRASALGIDPEIFGKTDIHVHVPAGATPKDGPSAGVAMFMALTSLLTGRTVRNDTATRSACAGWCCPSAASRKKWWPPPPRESHGSCCQHEIAATGRIFPRMRATNWNSSGWRKPKTRRWQG